MEAPSEGDLKSILARLRSVETLRAAYDAWLELKREHTTARAGLLAERARLQTQGTFLLGAVRAAGEPPASSTAPEGAATLVRPSALDGFLSEADGRMKSAQGALDARLEAQEARAAASLAALKLEVRARVQRFVGKVLPRLELTMHPAGPSKVVLHLGRLRGDDPVVLLYLLTGCIPSRYDFLTDETTEDASLPPPPLYAEEGVSTLDIRPAASDFRAYVHAAEDVLAVKGCLPLWLDRREGGADFFRLLSRGPVLEVEREEGSGFQNLLTQEEAERVAGYFLRLKLAGKVELELMTS